MTHYDVHYPQTDLAAKAEAGLADCRDWFGDRFESIVASFRKDFPEPPNGQTFRFYMSLLGVQGYPCKPMYTYIWPNASLED